MVSGIMGSFVHSWFGPLMLVITTHLTMLLKLAFDHCGRYQNKSWFYGRNCSK